MRLYNTREHKVKYMKCEAKTANKFQVYAEYKYDD